MKTIRQPLMLAASLAAALALGACGKSSEPATPVPSAPPPSGTAMTTPPVAPSAFPPPAASAGMPDNGALAAVSLSSLELGTSVDANHKIMAAGTSFAPKDTIYASVETMGSGQATLSAKWIGQDGQTVHEDSKVLDAMGPQTTAFMISQPDGFPEGNYKVEISLDGQLVARKDFAVKK